jgi:nitrate reductase NapE component
MMYLPFSTFAEWVVVSTIFGFVGGFLFCLWLHHRKGPRQGAPA